MLSNLNGDLAGQIPVKKEKLFLALPSTQTIISTNFYSSHKELGKALFMYQTRLNTSQYLWRQNNWEQLKIRELQSLAKQRLRARSRKKRERSQQGKENTFILKKNQKETTTKKKKERLAYMRIRIPHLQITIPRLHLKPFPWYLRRQTPFKADQAVLNRKLI